MTTSTNEGPSLEAIASQLSIQQSALEKIHDDEADKDVKAELADCLDQLQEVIDTVNKVIEG